MLSPTVRIKRGLNQPRYLQDPELPQFIARSQSEAKRLRRVRARRQRSGITAALPYLWVAAVCGYCAWRLLGGVHVLPWLIGGR